MQQRLTEMPAFDENSVGTDQMLRSVASDLGLYCLSMAMSLL